LEVYHGTPVESARQFREQLAKQDLKSGVRLLVQAGDMRRFVLLESGGDLTQAHEAGPMPASAWPTGIGST
jgi:hypothetical protein